MTVGRATRGTPLMLCRGTLRPHQLTTFYGPRCPVCRVEIELAAAQREILRLLAELTQKGKI